MRHTLLAAAALMSGAALAVPANAAPALHSLRLDTATIEVREANEAPRREDRQQDRRQDRRHTMQTPSGFDPSGIALVRESERRGRGDRR